ncbi:hypothetical protein KAU85_03415, partial [Candidatus Bathyarchaeota archaeon]|nr:hypothetical protein [Candidatus Bathyarchaeota archaeon]
TPFNKKGIGQAVKIAFKVAKTLSKHVPISAKLAPTKAHIVPVHLVLPLSLFLLPSLVLS